MAKVTVDFSQVEEFEPLDKGEYDGVILKGTFVEPAEADKYPYINVEIDMSEVPEGASAKVWIIWSLSPKALWRMKQDFENLGLPSDEIDIDYDEDTMLVSEPEIAGMPVVVVCDKPRTYEGRLQTNAVALLEQGGAPKKKTAPTTAAKKTTTTTRRKAPARASTSTAKKKPTGRRFK